MKNNRLYILDLDHCLIYASYQELPDLELISKRKWHYLYHRPNVKDILKYVQKTGDLVFFKIKTRDISHVGVYLSDNKFIQSSKSGVNVASLDNSYWKRYYYKSGRLTKM